MYTHGGTRWVEVRMASGASMIAARQNEPDMLVLQGAVVVAHRRACRLESARALVSLALAGAGLHQTVTGTAVAPLAIVASLWAVVSATAMAAWRSHELARAALLQEMFDVEVFGIGWNEIMVGHRLSEAEVNRLSKRQRGTDTTREYYVIHHPAGRLDDAMGCQEQNLAWGARIGRRYAAVVMSAVVAWAAAGLALGLVRSLTLTDLLLSWYIPSLGLLLLGVDTFARQRAVAAERERVLGLLRARLGEADAHRGEVAVEASLHLLSRRVQDILFLARTRAPRVPTWLYDRFRTGDQADYDALMIERGRRRRSRPATS